MGFTINIAKGIKKPSNPTLNKVSRLCLGTTIKDEEGYKIKVSLRNDPEYPDYIVVPFTSKSLDLRDKQVVYQYEKDKLGHRVAYVRQKEHCHFFPGCDNQYTVVVEDVVCSGYVVRINGKLYFDLKDTHGRGSSVYNIPNNISELTPLFPN